jgi:large repetitive protein
MKRFIVLILMVIIVCALIVSVPSISLAGLVASENFESGATGWNDNTTTNGGTNFTTFLGRFGGTSGAQTVNKTYALSGTQTQVTVTFNFYEIDSWDYEYFKVFINDAVVSSLDFKHNVDDGTRHGLTKIFSGDNGNINYGFSTWPDQGYLYQFVINTTGTSLKLGFGSTLNQGIGDEAWGIDNVIISDNASSVPIPAAFWLLGSGLVGLVGLRKRTASKNIRKNENVSSV